MEVILDRTRADKQSCPDRGVREALPGEPCDLGLLSSEVVPRLCDAFAGTLASGEQLSLGACGEGLCSHARKHLAGRTQLLARVPRPSLAPQPLAVEQVSAGELH